MCHAQMVSAVLTLRVEGPVVCAGCGRGMKVGEKGRFFTCKQKGQIHRAWVCPDCYLPTVRERWLAKLRKFL